jgi:hypothetical protein
MKLSATAILLKLEYLELSFGRNGLFKTSAEKGNIRNSVCSLT